MDLLRVLAIPFQFTSLVFVAMSSLVLGLVWGSGSFATQLIGLFGTLVVLAWLTAYAFRFLDDVANGVREAAVASAEMANPFFHDARSWVHPLLALAFIVGHIVWPALPGQLSVLAAVLLFPASIAASAMSGRARDALNPQAMGRVIAGLGPWYAMAVLICAGCAASGVLLARSLGPGWLMFAALELLLLVAYAGIGGVVYQRRIELGFAARISPERDDEKAEVERARQRQRMLDELFVHLRGGHADRALAVATEWVRGAPPHCLHGDVKELLEHGCHWHESHHFAALLRGLTPVLTSLQQPSLARAAEAEALRITASRQAALPARHR